MTLYLPIAPPGAGKSTLAHSMVKAGFFTQDAIVEPDHYRWVLAGDKQVQDCNGVVFSIVDRIVTERLRRKLDVYVDATNLVRNNITGYISHARAFNHEIILMPTLLSAEKIMSRNTTYHRENTNSVVPEHAMHKMIWRLHSFDLDAQTGEVARVEFLEDMQEYCDDLIFDQGVIK